MTVRVPFTANSTQIEEIYKQTSGLLFMGGAATLPQAARDLYALKVKGDESGDFTLKFQGAQRPNPCLIPHPVFHA